jgi:hypothetical protein
LQSAKAWHPPEATPYATFSPEGQLLPELEAPSSLKRPPH